MLINRSMLKKNECGLEIYFSSADKLKHNFSFKMICFNKNNTTLVSGSNVTLWLHTSSQKIKTSHNFKKIKEVGVTNILGSGCSPLYLKFQ